MQTRKVTLKQPKPLDNSTATIARKLMQNMSWNMPPSEVNRQAMMVKHFNQNADGSSNFSHNSLGTKFRRYGT